MLRPPPPRLRVLVVALVLASLGVQPMPARAVAPVGRHAAALAPSVPLSETLALPSGRGDGQLAIEQRGRAPMPLLSFAAVAASRVRPARRAAQPVAPRARSHPARRVVRASEDPPPH